MQLMKGRRKIRETYWRWRLHQLSFSVHGPSWWVNCWFCCHYRLSAWPQPWFSNSKDWIHAVNSSILVVVKAVTCSMDVTGSNRKLWCPGSSCNYCEFYETLINLLNSIGHWILVIYAGMLYIRQKPYMWLVFMLLSILCNLLVRTYMPYMYYYTEIAPIWHAVSHCKEFALQNFRHVAYWPTKGLQKTDYLKLIIFLAEMVTKPCETHIQTATIFRSLRMVQSCHSIC